MCFVYSITSLFHCRISIEEKKTIIVWRFVLGQSLIFGCNCGNCIVAAKDYQRAVKCYFICTESLADIDLNDPNFKYFTQVHAARCHIMHIHTVPTMAKFASRLQLALSKSATADINLTHVDIEIKMIEDVRCKVNSSFSTF
jgi:hypothetical protein